MHTYQNVKALESACQTISKETGCNASCIEENSKQEHEKMGIKSDTQLRADSSGQNTPEKFKPKKIDRRKLDI